MTQNETPAEQRRVRLTLSDALRLTNLAQKRRVSLKAEPMALVQNPVLRELADQFIAEKGEPEIDWERVSGVRVQSALLAGAIVTLDYHR